MVHLTKEQVDADPGLLQAVERFVAPLHTAGREAAEWLKTAALGQSGHNATYVLLEEEHILAFYALGMGEVELRTQHRRKLTSPHPRSGAVLVLWLARAADVDVNADTRRLPRGTRPREAIEEPASTWDAYDRRIAPGTSAGTPPVLRRPR